MEGLTLSAKEQRRLQILYGVLERYWTMKEAAPLHATAGQERFQERSKV